jgi:hypothetical protein
MLPTSPYWSDSMKPIAQFNALIETEVGEDRGQMLPTGPDANWTLDPSVGTLRM